MDAVEIFLYYSFLTCGTNSCLYNILDKCMDRQWNFKEIMEESKRSDVPLYLCHRNAQTYISYSLTFGESIWTLARLHMAKWHDIRIQTGHNSLCQMDVKFNFWNCGDRWPPFIYIHWKCLTEDHRSLMIMSRGVAL